MLCRKKPKLRHFRRWQFRMIQARESGLPCAEACTPRRKLIRGGAAESWMNLPARISDVLTPWAERSPDQPALVEASGGWTYRQLAFVVSDTQTWLLDSGVRPGDRVMIVCENCRAFVAILLALAGLDAWPVLVNARLSAREADEIRVNCAAPPEIYTTSVSPQAREHAKRHGAVVTDAEALGQIGIGPVNENVEPEPLDADVAHRVGALIYTS